MPRVRDFIRANERLTVTIRPRAAPARNRFPTRRYSGIQPEESMNTSRVAACSAA
jgi:hypothetical protein